MQTPNRLNIAKWGATLLRLSLGVMFLTHSVVLKLFTYGLPGWLAYVTFVCELVGGVLLVLGVQARWAARGEAEALARAA